MTCCHFPHAGIAAFLTLSLSWCGAAAAAPPAAVEQVDPFIGTLGEGNVFVGATVPFGFIQVGPDTGAGSGASGYKNDKPINGFSQQHISGMGGPLYGHLSLMPLTGALVQPGAVSASGKLDEVASPGYYAVTLAPWQVKVELTATRHAALHRYTFPAGAQGHVLVDAGHVLYGDETPSWNSAKPLGGAVRIDAARREVSGFMRYQGARSSTRSWKVYFVARFDTPFTASGTWTDAGTVRAGSASVEGARIGAYLDFAAHRGQVVNSTVALSYRSVARARGYIEAEAPAFDFARAREAARAQWRRALSAIEVEGGSAAQRRQFYSALYRLHLSPNDWTGEAPARYGNDTYYENILCMWDTFRTVNPMLTLIAPKVQSGIVNSILGYYRHDGWTGDAHSAHHYEHVQNGSNADVIIADAYVKHLPGIDWRVAYRAVRKNAFVDDNPHIDDRPDKGRFRLDDYRAYGYVPADISAYKDVQSVSRTLEYVHDDAAVLTLARRYGSAAEVAELERRVFWYRHVWDPDTGFMRGKNKDGSWHVPFNPTGDIHGDATRISAGTGAEYYEGHAWTWSWYVPHDPQGLINLMGGRRPFVEKLRTAVEHYYEAYNEPGMLQTFLFSHAGRPDLTQYYLRQAIGNFNDTRAGLPGNDDSATTSTWLLWAMLGIYPNAGQDYYYLASPVFSKATIRLGNGRQVIIRAPGTSAARRYVSAVTVNGHAWNQAWLRHADIANGAEITFTMSEQPSSWGAGVPPPSLSAPAAE